MTDEQIKETEEFIEDRYEAFMSLDKDKILAYAKKYEVPLPTNDVSFWLGIHKARYHATDIPNKERSQSRRWILDKGYSLSLNSLE